MIEMSYRAHPYTPTEDELLRACRNGQAAAVDHLVHLHAASGVHAARLLAPPAFPNDQLLDLVHDAFITAFDDALESDAQQMGAVYHQLIQLFLQRDAGTCVGDGVNAVIRPGEMRQLHVDLVEELRIMVTIHVDSPTARTPARRLLAELRTLRRRLRLAAATLQKRLPQDQRR